MLKGHIQIDLHNHNSGFTERYEQDNMVTNALNYIIPNWIGGNCYANDAVLPLCSKALGGIMLFDNTLTEDEGNIFFPSNAHLLGYAGQGTNTSNTLCGSYNSSESKELDTGYQTVWDFGTSQANGNIQSLARSLAEGGSSCLPFRAHDTERGSIHQIRNSNGNTGWNPYPLTYDVENQEMYFLTNLTYDSTYDSNTKVYTYTFGAEVRKSYIPTNKYKVADSANRSKYSESVVTLSIETKSSTHNDYNSNPFMYVYNGYDGYAYCINVIANSSGNATLRYFKIKLSDYSFECDSEWTTVTLQSVALRGGYNNHIINNGKAFLTGYNSRWIYIVDLSNPTNVMSVDLGSDYWRTASYRFSNFRNGIVKCIVQKYSSSTSRYYWYEALIYPDGYALINGYYISEGTSISISSDMRAVRLITDNLLVYGNENYNYSYGYLANNYLGTICNLSSAVTKTAASSMKVTYTLTDVDS